MSRITLLCWCLLTISVCVFGESRIHTTGDVTWMLMESEDGEPQLAILSGLNPEDLVSEESTPDTNIVLRYDVTIILYTRENNSKGGTLINMGSMKSLSEFNASKDTKILVHGFSGNLMSPIIQTLKNGWIDNEDDYNIIAIDWSKLCPSPFYNTAKRNSLLVGAHLARLIDFLIRKKGANLSQFHLIGHSLGGQVVGVAGERVSNGKVARITALDPALPLFDMETEYNRLDPSDAVLVDVIHTDGGALGFLTPVGHIDFYPNGGLHPQPGCESDISGQCSHNRCLEWYADSIIKRNKYPARLCTDLDSALIGNCNLEFTGMMGDNIGDTPHGIYYLRIHLETAAEYLISRYLSYSTR